jgi:PHD/YefM family antitoxin component YafN of YafNO toxin-antitoxin module
MPDDTIDVMKEVNAVGLRQSLGRLARALERTGEPVLLKVGQKPVGVIVSLRDFKERFALIDAADERQRLVEEILADRKSGRVAVDDAVAELRSR